MFDRLKLITLLQAAITLLFFATCSSATGWRYDSVKTMLARERSELDIREAVFRYQFRHNASGQQQKTGVYCLSLTYDELTDPPAELMKRFSAQKPPVREASNCVSDLIRGVRDKVTGKPGIVFFAAKVDWISANVVDVWGGYYEGGLSASGNTYRVVRRNGRWTVVKDHMNWIS